MVMRVSMPGSWTRLLPLCFVCGGLSAQTTAVPPAASSKIEPGLEAAVNWKWKVAPSAGKEWGMPLPEWLRSKVSESHETKPAAPAESRPESYEVKKGDAIVKIAKRFDMTPYQLKQFNALKDDRIVIGQILRIPTAAEVLAMAPPPPPEPKPEDAKKKNAPKSAEGHELLTYEQLELETVLIQVFLDREMFSAGAIDGKSGPMFTKVGQLYQQSHPDAPDAERLKAKAIAEVKQPYANYALRAEDFMFIKTQQASGKAAIPGRKRGKTVKPVPPPVSVTYQELAAADFLAYSSAWEFVAERFHCDEAFLRYLNSKLGETPAVGAVFKVPNVIPFEIEKVCEVPLQPSSDPANPVTAAIVGLSRLEISRGGKLIAVMPVASARPGLRGRGSWTVLDVIPQPRLATKREPRETPKPPSAPVAGAPPAVPPPAAPVLETEQFLASGPNSPIGVLWINLAKSGQTDPLPYGLHGTGIPARMRSLEGIGGFRLTNWDLARAVRLMPAGTALQWKNQ